MEQFLPLIQLCIYYTQISQTDGHLVSGGGFVELKVPYGSRVKSKYIHIHTNIFLLGQKSFQCLVIPMIILLPD